MRRGCVVGSDFSPSRVEVTVARLPRLGAVEVVSAHDAPLEPQLRDDYSLRLVASGKGRYTLRRGRTRTVLVDEVIGPGLLVVEPGDLVSSRPLSDRGWTIRRLYFPAMFWSSVDGDAATAPPLFPEPRVRDPDIVDAFLHAHTALERGATSLAQTALVTRLLCLVRRCGTHAQPLATRAEPEAVRRAKTYLQDRFADSVSLADVAEHVGLSPYYLLEVFRAATGLPIHQYQIHVRIAKARLLLARGVSVARAATESGFADQSHLGRLFKRVVGMTPATYAAAWNAVDAADQNS